MGKGHYPPPKPPKPVNPGPVNPNPGPSKPSVPLIWWTENEQGRLTDAEKANVGIATLIIQRDNGTLWRVSEDKPPYAWIQLANGGGSSVTGDPYKNHDPEAEGITEIKPWMRLLGGAGKTFTIAPMSFGDSFEIVDDERMFNQAPVTLIPAQGMKFAIIDNPGDNLVLDTVGQGTTWRFFIVAGDIVVTNVP